MVRRGFNIVAFYDDFFVSRKGLQNLAVIYNTFLKLLRSLGFSINWRTAVDPTQSIVFSSIKIDTCAFP